MSASESLRSISTLWGNERGSVAIMAAAILVMSIGALALGVDMASVFLERRRAQGAADLAAIAAASDLARARAATVATVSDNRVHGVREIVVMTGRYTADAKVAPANRFLANSVPANAAHVELHSSAPLYFARAFMRRNELDIVTQATAVATGMAAFSVGSRLLSLNGGILNTLLGRALGGNVSLTAMDYRALADFHVDLFQFSDALAIEAKGRTGTYDDLAKSNVTIGNVIQAILEVSRGSADGRAAQLALKALGQADSLGLRLPAGQLIDYGPNGSVAIGQASSALAARASALSILMAAAQVANGARQVEALASLSLPGLAKLTLGITIGERPRSSPWIAFGQDDVRIYTAQARVRMLAEVGGSGLLHGVDIKLPVLVDVAAATARLLDVQCGSNPTADARVTLGVTPAAIDAWIAAPQRIGDWTSFGKPNVGAAEIVRLQNGIRATGQAHVQIANLFEDRVTFGWRDIESLRPKTVRTRQFTASLVSGLARDLKLEVKAGLASLATPALIAAAVQAGLASVTPVLDATLNDLLRVLGVGVGEADAWVHGVRCDGAALVN